MLKKTKSELNKMQCGITFTCLFTFYNVVSRKLRMTDVLCILF